MGENVDMRQRVSDCRQKLVCIAIGIVGFHVQAVGKCRLPANQNDVRCFFGMASRPSNVR